jgi:hypothetical protein
MLWRKVHRNPREHTRHHSSGSAGRNANNEKHAEAYISLFLPREDACCVEGGNKFGGSVDQLCHTLSSQAHVAEASIALWSHTHTHTHTHTHKGTAGISQCSQRKYNSIPRMSHETKRSVQKPGNPPKLNGTQTGKDSLSITCLLTACSTGYSSRT